MDSELLLTWMSEVGSGDVRDLRQRVAWAARAADLSPKSYESGRWLRDISALAHAEIHWDARRWAIAPPAAVLLPHSGGTAVLAGSRRIGLIDRLDEVGLAVHIEGSLSVYGGPLPVPPSVYVQADSIEDLKQALNEVGIKYAGYAAKSIASQLPQIGLGAPAGPPVRGDATAEHLSPRTDEIRFRSGLPSGDGLASISVLGRPSYRYRLGDSWFLTDRATGILLDRAARGINVFRWRRERISDSEGIGTVFIDQGAPLPPLQARALVLCSGLPTGFGNNAQTAIYRNVPEEIAGLVSRSIRQHVSIIS